MNMYFKGIRAQPYTAFKNLLQDSLFLNAVYQMLGTGVLAVFGFFFWLLCAKLASAEVIGIATTLLSVANMIAVLGLIGFDTALMRFLSHSKTRNDKINTSLLLVAGTAAGLSALFLLMVPIISPHLTFIQSNPVFASFFVLFSVTFALNFISGAVFLAYRKTQYSLLINTLFSVIKLFLPFLFIGWGAYGIFIAASLAQTIGFALSLIILIKRFDYRPQFVINRAIVARVWQYSLNNYVAGVLNLLPLLVLPIIITNNLGPASAAYFYLIMMIGSLLYMIPGATSRSLLAEGSHNEKDIPIHAVLSMRTMTLFLTPAILAVLIGGKYILNIFGLQYGNEVSFLYLVALSGISVAVYSLYSSLLRVKHDGRALVIVNIIYAASVLSLSYVLMPLGLYGVGLAWLSGNTAASIASFVLYRIAEYQGPPLAEKWDDFTSLVISSKFRYARARIRNSRRITVLSYPDKPKFFHSLYMACHRLGYRVSNDPSAPFDIVILFKDATFRPHYPALEEIPTASVINVGCNDISKSHVDEVFADIFGYSSLIDPTTYKGAYVKKSNANATHDGVVMNSPTIPQEGYVYQKLIDNRADDTLVVDIRVPFYNGIIPFCALRYKSINDRFDHTLKTVVTDINEQLSPQEIERLRRFCEAFHLDYGELDLLRDKDGRLYIVDVNTTPAGPRISPGMTKEEFERFYDTLASTFEKAFVDRS